MKVKFYRCKICGKIVAIVNETAVPTICCGQEMYELLPNTTEGAFEDIPFSIGLALLVATLCATCTLDWFEAICTVAGIILPQLQVI